MKKKIISIITIIVVLIIIVGIWLIKNSQKEIIEGNNGSSDEVANEDFKLNLTGELDLEKLKSYNLPIIIDFGSSSCMPCRQMAPDLRKVNNELQGKAIIKYVDAWKYTKIAEEYSIELIPTQIFFNSDGTPYVPENAEELGLEIVKDQNGNHIFTKHIGILTEKQMKSVLKEMGLNE